MLRDYIKATSGFATLEAETGASPKGLMRMFSASGNPQARNLFAIIGHSQSQAGVTLQVTAHRNARGRQLHTFLSQHCIDEAMQTACTTQAAEGAQPDREFTHKDKIA